MRKVILYMQMTVDGFIAGPNNELDWMVPMEDEEAIGMGLIDRVDTALIGHGVYKDMVEYWPAAAENPSTPPSDAKFANKMNDISKLVFSRTEEKLEWKNAKQVLVKDDHDIAEEVAKLKSSPGKDMVLYGGVHFAQTFAQLGLIDEYRFVVHPVVLGSGKPLFKDKMNLKLIDTKTDNSGVMLVCYQPA